ncbi:MAG: GrpB family protein [Cytophagales bacterium]|nr:GrpB family protein [Cytophagales bacterium]
MSFGKGYNLNGVKEQIYHIHMCPKGNYMWRQIEFRDYLIAHPDRTKAYERLKIDLASGHKNDRGGYVVAKTAFINETLDLIKGKASH